MKEIALTMQLSQKKESPGGDHPTNITGAVPPPRHPREEERIKELSSYEILDTGNDQVLDGLTRLAALVLDVPIVLVALVDKERVWFKSAYGFSHKETDRDLSFCGHTILNPEKILVIPDTLKDPRFATNPFVTGKPHIRFYAGTSLIDGKNLPLGSFCVIDTKPREFNDHQLRILRELGSIGMNILEKLRAEKKIAHLLHLEKQATNQLSQNVSTFELKSPDFSEAMENIMLHLDANLGWLSGRIHNLQTGVSTRIFDNPELQTDPELALLWNQIGSHPEYSTSDPEDGRMISSSTIHPEYYYCQAPVIMGSNVVALIELIFPREHEMDHRLKNAFDIITSNLAVITERELTHLELQYRATHDALTGAGNREIIMEAIKTAIRDIDPLAPDSALLYFDIDEFKEVNDHFGHETGDRLLVEITHRLESVCRSQDMIGRLSGDEFVLLARGIDVDQGLTPLLERIRRTLSSPFMLGNLEIKISSSVGCAVLTSPEITPADLLRRAEQAMYLVKNGERKNFCIADAEVLRELEIRRSLDRRVKDAFNNDRFMTFFQPIVNLRTGQLAGAEALLRLKDAHGVLMTASEFIHAIERTRYLAQTDERVFAEALRTFSAETTKTLLLNKEFRISINISPGILSSTRFAEHCLRRLGNAGTSPQSITLEILETNLHEINESILKNLSQLRERGVRIALDDFGCGYNNLKQLSLLPIDIIKIDKGFLAGIESGDQAKNGLLNAIMGIGQNLGYDILAEGIETSRQCDYLRSIGCHFGQGYYFGKAMPMKEFLTFIDRIPSLNPFPKSIKP